jgi:hypothetical protein
MKVISGYTQQERKVPWLIATQITTELRDAMIHFLKNFQSKISKYAKKTGQCDSHFGGGKGVNRNWPLVVPDIIFSKDFKVVVNE